MITKKSTEILPKMECHGKIERKTQTSQLLFRKETFVPRQRGTYRLTENFIHTYVDRDTVLL